MRDKFLQIITECKRVAGELTWIDFVLALPTIIALSYSIYNHVN